ncbi:MAG: hypothetical protein ACLP8A_07995 [Methylovirgula sp.]
MPIVLKDIHISGAQTGIKIGGGDIISENVTFDNVEQPWDVSGVRSTVVRGTRIKNDPKARGGKSARMGWTKPNGPPLPAFCPECKVIFSSRNYNFGGAFFNAWDNEETCPKCGNEHAKLSEGTFNLSKEAVEILTAPDMTHAMLEAIANVANEVLRCDVVDAESTISLFELISPRVAAFLRSALKLGQTTFTYAVGAAGIASYILMNEQTNLAREQTSLAREQTEIARKQIADQTQTKILESLGVIETTLQGMSQQRWDSHSGLNTVFGTDHAEVHSGALCSRQKQKARHLRRKDVAAKRRAFGGSRSR